MVQPGIGLETPRHPQTKKEREQEEERLKNLHLDFDISQEQSFQSPSKDQNNLLAQLQNRRGVSLRTPRSRVALGDRRNVPTGGEFTPLLKSATRNNAVRNGKENVPSTPGFLKGGLENIPEDFSPLPVMGSSVYGQDSRNGSYVAGTPMPQIDTSSAASTPLALLPRRIEGPGVLQDGNQLSLREQENVIDKIEKENFGLKLKIHFLEEALRKAGPGYSEAAVKENTELKVDKVTMQKELHRYRKTLSAAERDVEVYRQQLIEMQEKIKRKHLDEGQRGELDRLKAILEEREAELELLRSQEGQYDDLQDKVHDLEAELREKDRVINDREDELDNLKDDIEKYTGTIADLKETIKDSQRRAIALEEKAQASEDLDIAKETIGELERDLGRAKNDAQDAKEEQEDAFKERDRAQADLEELQDEMANKSITTKGLSRQIEEKANRLQDELDDLRDKHSALAEDYEDKVRETKKLQDKIEDLKQDSQVREENLKVKLETAQGESNTAALERDALETMLEPLRTELQQKSDEKDLLQVRHDALTSESAGLQKDLSKSRRTIENLEDKLKHEQTLALASERDVRDEYKDELDRLHTTIDGLNGSIEQLKEKVEDLEAEVRQKERLYDDDNDKWCNDRRNLESERDRAEEKANGLQRAIGKLQEAEGDLSSKETKLQQALQSEKDRHIDEKSVLTRQINELNGDVEAQQKALEQARSELAKIREGLRLSQREQKLLVEKAQGLEDEVELLQTTLEEEIEQANHDFSVAKQESEALRYELQVLKRDLDNAKSVASGAQAQLDAFRGDLQAGEGSKDQLASRLKDVEGQLAKLKQDKQSLQSQVVSTNAEVHSLRASKADLESERDELQSQLRAMEQQDKTFRLDQEGMELRTAKMKLDAEVRRLRDENKLTLTEKTTLERELQVEIDRAAAEEHRLSIEIHDLQKILRGSSEKRELSTAKKTIQHLEERIQDLESQLASAGDNEDRTDAINETNILRQDLADTRQKETEYHQREAAQRDVVRGLKRQIAGLERKAHDIEISRLAVVSSPHSSASGSARKSELVEVRHQLAIAHQTVKDIRAQLKDVEKDATRKVGAVNMELQRQTEAWEAGKDQLERSLDEALLKRDELAARNTTSEATITRLRSKIERLETALQAERQNATEDRTMALERRDLHEMLRETQVQAESLELVVKDREATIASISAAESELRTHLKRVRDERALHRSKAVSTHEQLENLERKFNKAQEAWEAERKTLTKGVRFPNMSLSVNDESELLAMKAVYEKREKEHVKDIRGMQMQAEWLRAKCKREADFHAGLAYQKHYMAQQIDLFEACNRADLSLLLKIPGTTPSAPKIPRKATFREVAILIRATIRMKRGAAAWAKSKQLHAALEAKLEENKRLALRKSLSEVSAKGNVRGSARKGTPKTNKRTRSMVV